MIIYFLIFILLVFLSFRYDILGGEKYKSFWIKTLLTILILLAGLRYRIGSDTPFYIYHFYRHTPQIEDFSFSDYNVGSDPLWILLNSIFLSLGCKFFVVQLIQSAFVNVLLFRYIYKHTKYVFSCFLFYFITYYLGYNTEIMRAGMSIVICLFANDYVLEHKWGKGLCLFFIASLFHFSALLICFFSFFSFIRLNLAGLLIVVSSFALSFFIQYYFYNYLTLLSFSDEISDKALRYADSREYLGQIFNLNYLIVYVFPNIVYPLICAAYIKTFKMNSQILKLEPFVMLGILFYAIQINIQLAYRFAVFYGIYFIIFYANTFVELIKSRNKISIGVAYARSCILFLPFFSLIVYSNIPKSYRYIPYSSIIDRKIDSERESIYRSDNLPYPNVNEW